jgi:hypothetical protein
MFLRDKLTKVNALQQEELRLHNYTKRSEKRERSFNNRGMEMSPVRVPNTKILSIDLRLNFNNRKLINPLSSKKNPSMITLVTINPRATKSLRQLNQARDMNSRLIFHKKRIEAYRMRKFMRLKTS